MLHVYLMLEICCFKDVVIFSGETSQSDTNDIGTSTPSQRPSRGRSAKAKSHDYIVEDALLDEIIKSKFLSWLVDAQYEQ